MPSVFDWIISADDRMVAMQRRILRIDERIVEVLNFLLRLEGAEMATLQDIKNALDAHDAKEDQLIALVQQQRDMLTDLQKQLQDAINANDPSAMQAILDQINEDAAQLDAALAQQPTPTPTPQPTPTPTPEPTPEPTPTPTPDSGEPTPPSPPVLNG